MFCDWEKVQGTGRGGQHTPTALQKQGIESWGHFQQGHQALRVQFAEVLLKCFKVGQLRVDVVTVQQRDAGSVGVVQGILAGVRRHRRIKVQRVGLWRINFIKCTRKW